MAPPPEPPAPLPLAANRAALSNQISLLLASQSSVLKTMNLSRPASNKAPTRPRPADDDNDDDLRKGTRPNQGVGYVPSGKEAADTREEDRILRARLMGKRKVGERMVRRVDSESEGEGRSGLGRKKRKKVREVDVDVEEAGEGAQPEGPAEVLKEEVDRVAHEDGIGKDTVRHTAAVEDVVAVQAPKKKKKKKKKAKTQGAIAS